MMPSIFKRKTRFFGVLIAACAIGLIAFSGAGQAGDHHDRHDRYDKYEKYEKYDKDGKYDRGAGQTAAMLPAYQQECAGCHMAYQPGLLPAASWQRIMAGLERHYGSDAALDAASVEQIGAWLQANAGTSKRVRREGYGPGEGPPQDRITKAAWFDHKHDEVRPEVWRRASIKSAANCQACHTRAEAGSYKEREIRIPK